MARGSKFVLTCYNVLNCFNTTNTTNLLSVDVIVAKDEENISTIT